jgi:hypothetical protein
MSTQRLAWLASRLVSGNAFPAPPENHQVKFSPSELSAVVRGIPGFALSERCRSTDWNGVWNLSLDQGLYRVRALALDRYIVVFRVGALGKLTSVMVGDPIWPTTLEELYAAINLIAIHKVKRRSYGTERVLVSF